MPKAKRFGTSDCVSVRGLYDNFLRNATTLIGRHGASFDAQNLSEKLSVELSAVDRITVQTKSECGFWFSGLPRYKGNKSDVIEVCLSLIQTIAPGEKDGLVLLASNVHVSYFKCHRGKKYRVLESWHYDFAPNSAGHPVFHAQLSEDHLPPSSQNRTYKPLSRVPALKDLPRVPTPPLDLASVMEIIVADHLVDYHAIVDSEDWRKSALGLPQLPMSHLASWKSPVEKLRARHWYPTN